MVRTAIRTDWLCRHNSRESFFKRYWILPNNSTFKFCSKKNHYFPSPKTLSHEKTPTSDLALLSGCAGSRSPRRQTHYLEGCRDLEVYAQQCLQAFPRWTVVRLRCDRHRV